MNDKERVKKTVLWLISEGIAKSQKSIAEIMGYNSSSFSQIVTGDKPVSEKFIKNLSSLSEKINIVWLMTGDGDMLLDESQISNTNSYELQMLLSSINLTIAPLITQYAQAGYLNGFEDKEYLGKQPLYFATQKYTGASFVAFEVRGDSMDNGKKDAICNGDIVLGQGIPQDLWVNQLLTPRVFVVVHKVEGILLREVVEHNVEQGTITCRAFNPDRVRFPDMVLSLKEVLGMFGVKELKRGGF